MATQSISESTTPAASSAKANASAGNDPGLSWRETLTCSTAEASRPSLMTQQAGSLSKPPSPTSTRGTLYLAQPGNGPFPSDASEILNVRSQLGLVAIYFVVKCYFVSGLAPHFEADHERFAVGRARRDLVFRQCPRISGLQSHGPPPCGFSSKSVEAGVKSLYANPFASRSSRSD